METLARHGIVGEHLLAGLCRGHKRHRILDLDPLGATHRDGLEVLRAHDGADARAPGGAVQVVDDGGKENPGFA